MVGEGGGCEGGRVRIVVGGEGEGVRVIGEGSGVVRV